MSTENNTLSAAEAAITTREDALKRAVMAGRILASSIGDYRARWIREPRATAALIDKLEPGLPSLAAGDAGGAGPALSDAEIVDLQSTFGARRSPRPTREPDVGGSGYLSRVAVEDAEPAPATEGDLDDAAALAAAETIVATWGFESGTG